MQLKKLEIAGFKSFLNRLEMDFSSGITAVLGPNGCGKTNIVDAVRWVMGEQKTRMLRNSKMENVIFNGTKLRKPLGMAEVHITLSNEDHRLPVDYNDITITRRLFRSGSSEYLLNGKSARLKDIRSLLIDTGLGSNTYSIIEQEMVNAVISEKNNDKRALLEEAAGIMRYRVQREEALRKIKHTETDLTRLDDIVAELDRELRSLRYQMGKATRFQRLKERVDRMEGALVKRSLFELLEKRDAVKNDREHHEGITLADDNEILLIENKLQEAKVEGAEFERRLSDLHEQRFELSQALQRREERIAILSERIASNENRIREDEEEIGRATARMSSLAADLTSYTSTIDDKHGVLTEREARLREKDAVLKAVSEDLERLKHELRDKKQLALDLVREKERERGAREHLHNRLFEIEEKVQRVSSQASTLQGEEGGVLRKLEWQQQAVIEKSAVINDLTEQLESASRASDVVVDRLSDCDDRFAHANIELHRITEKKEYLERIQQEHSRRRDEVIEKAVGIKGVVADQVHVDKRYRRCFEACLGPVLSGLLAETRDDAVRCLDDLRNANKGTYQLLYPTRSGNDPAPVNHPQVIGTALDFVTADTNVIEALKPHLDGVVVTDDVDAAIAVLRDNAAARVATLDGIYFDGPGRILVAGTEDVDMTLLEFDTKLEELNSAIERASERATALESQREALVTDKAELQDRIVALRERVRDAEAARQQVAEEHKTLEIALAKIREKLAGVTDAVSENQRSIEEIQAKLEVEPRAAEDVIEMDSDEALSQLEDDAVQCERRKEAAAEEAGMIRLEVATLRGEIATANEKRSHIALLDGELKELIRTREEDAERCKTEIKAAVDEIEATKGEIAGKHGHIEAVEKDIDEIKSAYEGSKVLRDDAERQVRELKGQRDRKRENLQRCDLELATLDTRMTGLIERARESFNQDLEPYLEDRELFDQSEWQELDKSNLDDLRRKVETFGPVNMLALEEFNEKKERFDFLSKQKADLEEARDSLVQAIRRINKEARRRLTETFDVVRANFKSTFTSLFDGGEADLLFADSDDPLEANIKMVASPKGKRLHDVSSLSGGERALTALSLLFAIYLVKPSPFCVFDEVDAPLDDANVARFINMLRSFTDRTQFIVITHNKRTMEAADNLYGVTMGEPGVSKMISVHIGDVERFQDRPEHQNGFGRDISTQEQPATT